MASIHKRLKHTALFALVALGAVGASMSVASAAYLTQSCDRDGRDCVTLRCEDDGDGCRPAGNSYRQSDDDEDQPGDSPFACAPSGNGPPADDETRIYAPTDDERYGVWDSGQDDDWDEHSRYDDDDSADPGSYRVREPGR